MQSIGWSRRSLLTVAVCLSLAIAPAAHAADNDTGPPEPLNCGDDGVRQACIECDAGGPLGCCDTDEDGNPTCPIINEPPTTGLAGGAFALKLVHAGLKLSLSRKVTVRAGSPEVKVKLKQRFVSPNVDKTVALSATLGGQDAAAGSLAYLVGFMAMGQSAASALQAQGLSLIVLSGNPPRTCQDSFAPAECSALATQLAKAIDGALLPGNGTERTTFLQSVGLLGHPPCQIFC